jgi:tripartite-type tricarboxylate transporter receptor subunit TctC
MPFPPGGTTDILGRMVAQKLTEGLGQRIIIENRPGAAGTIASEMVAKAPADGYTLLFASASAFSIAPNLYANLGYDPQKSFAPISLLNRTVFLVLVQGALPAQSLQELIALAKAKPGQLYYGSAGNGTPLHIAGEMFNRLAGVRLVHVPYKGTAPAVADLVSGQVQVVFDLLVSVQAHIRSGKVRALAVAGPKRVPQLPDVPTCAQAGLPGFEVIGWTGLVAPSGTPSEIVRRLNTEVARALATQDLNETLTAQGADPGSGSPEEFAAFMNEQAAQWARAVKLSGARID